MTRPSRTSLVLDGGEVKYRLEAERLLTKTPVHVDWVRFTVILRNAPFIALNHLFPMPVTSDRQEPVYREWADRQSAEWNFRNERAAIENVLRGIEDCDFAPATQAYELAQAAAEALGPEFTVNQGFKKGHDFYKLRWCIERNGQECGWVGFLASGDSLRQKAQANTIHCNLFGAACTFATEGWRDRLADIVQARDATLTRCDLALDFFDGFPGGIKAIVNDYNEGRCNVSGKRLKTNFVGDWSDHSKGARSFYFGSKEAGKETNAYEKGDQLFGVDCGSSWLRVELRYGNKLRVLPVDMLRRPADFFAGASDWHATALSLAAALITPQKVLTEKRLPTETVMAECVRSLNWISRTAAPSFALVLQMLDVDQILDFIGVRKLPGRLQKFSHAEISSSYPMAFGRTPLPERSPAFAMA